VKCWGLNNFGQLGLGDAASRGDNAGEMGDALPAVDLGTNLVAVALATGAYHTCVVTNFSRIKCWGSNQYGQLGLGDIDARGDNAGEMGDALPNIDIGTIKFKLITLATGVTAGDSHTCARTTSGTVKCWGGNDFGQLGQGNTDHRGDNPGEMGTALPTVPLF
jgi:E3 ubiquitin-protein ligase HERC3